MGHVPVPGGPEDTVMGKRLSGAPQANFYGRPPTPKEEPVSSPEKSMPEAKTNKQKYHVAILETHSKLTGRRAWTVYVDRCPGRRILCVSWKSQREEMQDATRQD